MPPPFLPLPPLLLALPLPLLLLPPLPPPSLALSTCRPLDLEAARRKRIEAVRGQILSKLRLPEPPPDPPRDLGEGEDGGEGRELPEEVRALYNSTRELLRQRARGRTPEEPEEYYAKELLRFPMETPLQGPLERWRPTPHSSFFVFNLSRVRAELGRAWLSRAELRLLRQRAGKEGNEGVEQRLELYQGAGNGSWRFLHGRSVRATRDDEWMWFDVTESVLGWLGGDDPLGVFKLSVHCPCEGGGRDPPPMRISIEGFDEQRGDMQGLARRHRRLPHLLAMALPPERAQALHGTPPQNRGRPPPARARRALEGHSCGGSEEQSCCLRPLYIDFRRDLQWKWIHEPRGYMANFCGGPCPYIWSADSHYTKVLALYNLHNPGGSAAPCCVPQTLEPLPIVYYVGRKARVEQLSGMVVSACKCS